MGSAKRVSHLAVGRIVGAHGLHGEFKVDVITDFPERFRPGAELILEGEAEPRRLESVRRHKNFLLVRLSGLSTRSDVEQLRGLHLLVRRQEAMPLPEGEYYADELEGLAVITDTGIELGSLVEVMWTGVNEVYVVQGSFGEVLLPAIAEVIQEVDLEAGRMFVHLLPGLVPKLE